MWRITSTHVENTINYRHAMSACKDHLHTRGEYCNAIFKSITLLGSPPHTWRIQQWEFLKDGKGRITSTHVENTSLNCVAWVRTKDHLHTRGEYSMFAKNDKIIGQSPPHTWRILIGLVFKVDAVGITSTHVENTVTFRHHRRWGQDHLHTRGEYLRVGWCHKRLSGSPPHTWRIPKWLPVTGVICKDHLHTRGEYVGVRCTVNANLGSPPHTWRIHIQNGSFHDMFRITSTHVENTKD